MILKQSLNSEEFRGQVQSARLEQVKRQGSEVADEAYLLYHDQQGQALILRDSFYQRRLQLPVERFIQELERGWWASRCTLSLDEGSQSLVAGFYCHYLGEQGFDCLFEFTPQGAQRAWRRDARGREAALRLPEDEGMFRDQLGSFFNLRAGWRWLLAAHRESGLLEVAEIQPGYLIGVRAGVPGDPTPADREDPELEATFSRWARREYDTLEFLESPEARGYPFHGERYWEWLEEEAVEIQSGSLDLFIIADSSEFMAALRELAENREIKLLWPDEDDHSRITLSKAELSYELDFALPYLRCLHTGRSFIQGAQEFYLPLLHAMEEAYDLLQLLRKRLKGYKVLLKEGKLLEIHTLQDQRLGRWHLMSLAGKQTFRGERAEEQLLEFLSFPKGRFQPRPFSLERCPLSGEPARVERLIRPLELLGGAIQDLMGVELEQHLLCYVLESERYSSPIEPGPGRSVEILEAAYQRDLPRAQCQLLELKMLNEGLLFVGFDLGSQILEPARVKALLQAAKVENDGDRQWAYAFFPDALLLSKEALKGEALMRARAAAQEALLPRFPGRLWPLELARSLDLDVEPVGRVELL